MQQSGDLSGQIVLITGATGGLGNAVVDLFTESGATVYGMGQSEPDEWAGNGGFYAADLTDDAIAEEAISSVLSEVDTLDSLVALVGTWKGGTPIEETPVETFDSIMDINLKTTFLTAKYALPTLQDNGGGAMVTVSARSARQGGAGDGPYRASKAAVQILTESIAAENEGTVRANTILPSIIDTEMNRAMMPDGDHDSWVEPYDIANVISWLCSDRSEVTNGAAIPVYGQA